MKAPPVWADGRTVSPCLPGHAQLARPDSPSPRRAGCRGCDWALAAAVAAAVVAGVTIASSRRAAPAGASVSIVAPASGQVVRGPVPLSFDVNGMTLGSETSGADHLHLSVDGGPTRALYDTQASMPLPAGQHTVAVELAGPDHQPVAGPAQTTFTVGP